MVNEEGADKKPILIGLIILFLIAGGVIFYFAYHSHSPIPAEVQKQVTFPLYYPGKLPAGYALNKDSFQATSDAIVYYADKGNDRITISIQPRPQGFDFQKFYQQTLNNSEQFLTPLGQAGIGKAQDRLLGSLATDESWILVSSNSPGIKAADIRLVLSHLKKS
jgi:hypothetical protein